MSYWQFDLLAVALPAALLLRVRRPGAPLRRATAALVAVALLWTAPWDEYLVRHGIWSYGEGRVLGLIGSVPAEEYAFVVLLVALVAAWGERTGLLTEQHAGGGGGAAGSGHHRAVGAAGWLLVTAVGVLLVVASGPVTYLGLLLVWAGPPLALQRAVAGDVLAGRRRQRLLLTAPVVLWLCLADRVALAEGVWSIAPSSSIGLAVLGLPVEEALFFALTTALVADGLLLGTDAGVLARARALVDRSGPPVDRTGRPGKRRSGVGGEPRPAGRRQDTGLPVGGQ